MISIFNNLTKYGVNWSEVSRRKFTAEEIAETSSASVVPSEYGLSVCFVMRTGGVTYIPLSTNSSLGSGETVDLANAEIVTLERLGETVYRVEA